MTPYRERLTAPLSWWLAALVFAAVWGWVFLVVTTWTFAVVVTVALAAAGFAAVWRYGSILLAVGPEGLHVGAAFLESSAIGAVTVLDRAGYRHRLGVGADARAYLVTRPYLDHGVTVEIDDAGDPTPYWLLSSRHPQQLAAALGASPQQPAEPADDMIGETPRGEEGQ